MIYPEFVVCKHLHSTILKPEPFEKQPGLAGWQ
jgi:hypothetical protein